MPSLTGTTDHLPYSLRMGLARGTAISNAAPCSSLPSRRQRLRSLEDRRRRTHLPAPAPAPDPTRPDPTEIFRVPPPFRGRSASSGPLAPLRAALRRSQHGRRLPPLPILPRPPPPPKFSESRRRSADDRPARDPWHPSVRGCDPRSTAAACPRSRSYPRPPPKFSESRRRSVDDRPYRDPWHPSAKLRPSQHGRRLPPLPILPPAAAELFRVPPPCPRCSRAQLANVVL